MNEPIYCDLPIDDIIAQAKTRPDGQKECELGLICRDTLWVYFGVLDTMEWSYPYVGGAYINIKTREIETVAPQDRQRALDALREWFADREKECQTTQKGEN